MSKPVQTLCWDCAHATNKEGVCPWANNLEPVEGWVAEITRKNTMLETYVVYECPLFKRDAWAFGLKRIKKEDLHAST